MGHHDFLGRVPLSPHSMLEFQVKRLVHSCLVYFADDCRTNGGQEGMGNKLADVKLVHARFTFVKEYDVFYLCQYDIGMESSFFSRSTYDNS